MEADEMEKAKSKLKKVIIYGLKWAFILGVFPFLLSSNSFYRIISFSTGGFIGMFYGFLTPINSTWKKGAILGGVWGVLSIFILLASALGGDFGRHSPPPTPKIAYIILLPATLIIGLHKVLELYTRYSLNDNFYVLFVLVPFLSFLIGAFIGAVVGLGIEKFKMRSLKEGDK